MHDGAKVIESKRVSYIKKYYLTHGVHTLCKKED